jgi:hypothetical protein
MSKEQKHEFCQAACGSTAHLIADAAGPICLNPDEFSKATNLPSATGPGGRCLVLISELILSGAWRLALDHLGGSRTWAQPGLPSVGAVHHNRRLGSTRPQTGPSIEYHLQELRPEDLIRSAVSCPQ